MKKIKFLIASMIGAIALVFAAVFGTKINAESTQTYVNAIFSQVQYADDETDTKTSSFKTQKNFTIDGTVFTVSGGNQQSGQSNGFKF